MHTHARTHANPNATNDPCRHSQLKGGCPPHRVNDLDKLVKSLGGDEDKIREKISEWWEEPAKTEEVWEDVNKKAPKGKKPYHNSGRGGGRSDRGGRGRGYQGGRSGPGGRGGGGGERRGGRGRGSQQNRHHKSGPPPQGGPDPAAAAPVSDDSTKKDAAPTTAQNDQQQQFTGVPAPSTAAPVLKGAWGRRVNASAAPPAPAAPAASAAPAAPPAEAPAASKKISQPKPPKEQPAPEPKPSVDVGIVTNNDPTPAGLTPPVDSKPAKASVASTGNVWATKGSAHLIEAEKPKPPPVAAPPAAPVNVPDTVPESAPEPIPMPEMDTIPVPEEPEPEPQPEPVVQDIPMENELPAVHNPPPPPPDAWGTGVVQSSARTEEQQAPPLEPPMDLPVSTGVTESRGLEPLPPPMEEPVAVSPPEPVPVPVQQTIASPVPPPVSQVAPAAQTNVLNMGHWEAPDEGDSNIDFGFGSFGADNDVVDEQPSAMAEQPALSAPPTATTAVSPARPPPGLTIDSMPPMPTNGILVHELESKLENASLGKQDAGVNDNPPPSALPTGQMPLQSHPGSAPPLPTGNQHHHQQQQQQQQQQQGFNQYNMGMYGYGANNGFMSPPVLAGGVVPQQQQQPGKHQGGVMPASLPGQQTPYGSQTQSAPTSGNGIPNDPSINDSNAATAPSNGGGAGGAGGGMPPGMQGGMPAYPNVPMYQYNQYMPTQPQGGMGYQFYPSQFGNVTGGYGYQHMVNPNGAYGGPGHYGGGDDQGGPHQQSHSGGSGGFQKNNNNGGGGGSGNFHGRRNQHGNNQSYPNQFNHQQGGYAAQQFPMGYPNDHFNQRGGYPNNMADPYGNQPYQSHGGAGGGGFQEDDHKGKKGGHRGGAGNGSSLQQSFPQGQQHQLGHQSFGLQGQGSEPNQSSAGGGGGGWPGHQGWSGANPSWQGS